MESTEAQVRVVQKLYRSLSRENEKISSQSELIPNSEKLSCLTHPIRPDGTRVLRCPAESCTYSRSYSAGLIAENLCMLCRKYTEYKPLEPREIIWGFCISTTIASLILCVLLLRDRVTMSAYHYAPMTRSPQLQDI